MKKHIICFILFVLLSLSFLQTNPLKAQDISNAIFRMAEGFVRISEPGVFADTVSVFGDVNAPGRYILPRGTTIDELLGYARGPIQQRVGGQQAPDWGNIRLEITISKLDPTTNKRTQETFKFNYDQQYPEEFTDMPLGNDYIVSLRLKRRPAFIDYIRVFSTFVAATATTLIVVDRLTE